MSLCSPAVQSVGYQSTSSFSTSLRKPRRSLSETYTPLVTTVANENLLVIITFLFQRSLHARDEPDTTETTLIMHSQKGLCLMQI
eukprot:scaffold1771_cov211-Alexandrium_tamarense.AAC.36